MLTKKYEIRIFHFTTVLMFRWLNDWLIFNTLGTGFEYFAVVIVTLVTKCSVEWWWAGCKISTALKLVRFTVWNSSWYRNQIRFSSLLFSDSLLVSFSKHCLLKEGFVNLCTNFPEKRRLSLDLFRRKTSAGWPAAAFIKYA